MSLIALSQSLLFVTLVLVVIAGIGDTMASHQMATERFRWVPLVRLARWAQIPAALFVVAYLVVALIASPMNSVLAFQVGFLVALVGQARMVVLGAVRQALLRGFLPAIVLGVTLANLQGVPTHPQSQTLQLGLGPLVVALLAAVGFWYVAHQRTQQDLIRLRD